MHIITYHKPLEWLMSLKELNSGLIRWSLNLEHFDYDIIHEEGENHSKPDALSRNEFHTTETSNSDEESPFLGFVGKFNS